MDLESHCEEADQGSPVCPHCLKAISERDHFCPHCAGPVSAHASIDPLGQVYSAGHAYRRATSSPLKFITVLGMWLIFGPVIPLLVWDAAANLIELFSESAPAYVEDRDPLLNVLLVAARIAVSVLFIAILWKVTRRYRLRAVDADDVRETS